MVRQAVDAELSALPEEVRDSGHAAMARALADAIDHHDTSPNAKAICSKTLADILDRLRALAPAEQQEDSIDELRSRRDSRRAAS